MRRGKEGVKGLIICFCFHYFTVKDPKKIKRERISVHGFYRIGKVIGDGNFAVVRECKNRYTCCLSLYTLAVD